MNNQEEKILVAITEEYVQAEAEQELDRTLTQEELEALVEYLYEDLVWFVRENIRDMSEYNYLLERNKNARDVFPHYDITLYRPSLQEDVRRYEYSFLTEQDAHAYIRSELKFFDDLWKIIKVKEDGEEVVWSSQDKKP